MKKLILSIVLLSGLSLAQTNGALIGGGITFADSLNTWKDTTGYAAGTGWLYVQDTTDIIDLNLDYGFVSVVIQDTGTAASVGGKVDTLKLYKGSIRYTNGYSHTKVDTIWSSEALPVRDDYWAIDTVLAPGSGQVESFTIMDNNIQLLMIVQSNSGDELLLQGRRTNYIIQAKKD